MKPTWMFVFVLALAGCKDNKAPAAAGSGSGSSGSSGSASSGSGTAATTDKAPTPARTDDDPTTEEPAADEPTTVVGRVCKLATDCKCPIPDCEGFFAKLGFSDTVHACLATQACEVLCAPKAGAPGTKLYEHCIKGTVDAGPINKPCAATSDCPGKHECCSGYCYEMGTSLWITACQMPTGKF